MNLPKLLLATIPLLAVLAGCAGAGPTSSPNPDPVCDAAESLQASLTALRRMDPSTPVDDVKIAAAASAAAYDELRSSLSTFSDERVDALASAMRDLETAGRELPEGTTVENARNLLTEELEAVSLAWRALGSELGCPSVLNPISSSTT